MSTKVFTWETLSRSGGRRSGLVGKVGGASTTWVNTAGSPRVQARCCFSVSYLSISSETDHQKSRNPPTTTTPPPRPPPPSRFMPVNFTYTAAGSIFFPGERYTPLDTTHGISKTPCNELADDLHPCGRSIRSLRRSLRRALRVKVT